MLAGIYKVCVEPCKPFDMISCFKAHQFSVGKV